jgi:hypothetical protein
MKNLTFGSSMYVADIEKSAKTGTLLFLPALREYTINVVGDPVDFSRFARSSIGWTTTSHALHLDSSE